jgi:hypothetical protein
MNCPTQPGRQGSPREHWGGTELGYVSQCRLPPNSALLFSGLVDPWVPCTDELWAEWSRVVACSFLAGTPGILMLRILMLVI